MELIGHAIVFFFSSVAGYVVVKTPGNWLYYALFWGLFAGGVYLLGWWALLSCLFGIAFGGYLSRLLAELRARREALPTRPRSDGPH